MVVPTATLKEQVQDLEEENEGLQDRLDRAAAAIEEEPEEEEDMDEEDEDEDEDEE